VCPSALYRKNREKLGTSIGVNSTGLTGCFRINRIFCCKKIMKAEVTAIIETTPEGGFWAICPEFPGANGQGESIEETKESFRQAIELIVQDWPRTY